MMRNFQSRIEILRDYSVHGRIDSEIFLKEAGKFVIEFLSEVVTDKGSCCEVHEHVYRMEASLRSGWEKLGTTNWREILASYSDYVDGWLRLQEEYVRSLDAWYFEGVEANHPRKLT